MSELFRLLLGTLLLRPYVFVFLSIYLISCTARYGLKVSLSFLGIGYGVAFLSEWSSIHWGIPYGHYYYIHDTVGRELWVFGVPFMDSLSYVFLAYASFSTALFSRLPSDMRRAAPFRVMDRAFLRTSWGATVTGAALFMFLDVIIDPVAYRGDRWFLGKIYDYREPGIYFGIPWSNFAGWFLIGLILNRVLSLLTASPDLDTPRKGGLGRLPGVRFGGVALYGLILAGNLAVTFWIGEILLGLWGTVLTAGVALWIVRSGNSRRSESAVPDPEEGSG